MPCFSMDELSDFMLELLISERVRLTDVKGGVLWKIVAFIDGQNNGFHEVIEVNERIAVEQVAGIKITRELLFVNALNLVRDWYGMAFVVVCAGETERSEEHTSELQSRENLVCRLLLEKKKKKEGYLTM